MAEAFLRTALTLALALWTAGAVFGQEPGAAVEAQDPPPGPVVTAIEIRSDAPLDDSLELEALIETEVGEPLDEEEVRHTLRNLHFFV